MALDERDSVVFHSPDTGRDLDEKQQLEDTSGNSIPQGTESAPGPSLHNWPSNDTPSVEPPRNGSIDNNGESTEPPAAGSSQSAETSPIRDRVRNVQLGLGIRTLPAWIRSFDYPVDDTSAGVTDQLLPSQPNDAVVAQHNHSPYATTRSGLRGNRQGVASGSGETHRESRWKTFSETIQYPREPNWNEKQVAPEWLDNNFGDYSQPWRGRHTDIETGDPLSYHRRRDAFLRRFHESLLKSPIVPLVFRLTVWSFSVIALALGGSIQHLSQKTHHSQGPSALMAIVVDAVALVYTFYITWDEYTSKPLGLRSPRSKARLVLLDIVFIVFDSANLSLAFETLSTDSGSCTDAEINRLLSPKNDALCSREKALASVLLIALVAWLLTFSISVLRLVERVSR